MNKLTILTKYIEYMDGNHLLEGFMAWDDTVKIKKPGILVGHAWAGRSEFECKKAIELAAIGYVGFAFDIYGKGTRGKNRTENAALMKPFLINRELLQRRVMLALDVLSSQALVDSNKMATIGYCFGGLASLDMARCVADILGAVSLHGNLSSPSNTNGNKINAKILVLHGWKDPTVLPEDVVSFAKEMSAMSADWQLHAFGDAVHGFAKTGTNDPDHGMLYDEISDQRSWNSMRLFLTEIFS